MEEKNYDNFGFGTIAIHSGQEADPSYGALATPIYQTSTFCFENMEAVDEVLTGKRKGYVYSRGANPTVDALQKKIASLEGGESCIVTVSGMGAIGSVMLGLLKTGDHLVCGDCVYGPTKALVGDSLKDLGIEATFVDMSDMDRVEAALRDNTRMIYFETPSNPNMVMTDIVGVSELAHSKGITVVVDATFAPPPVQKPLILGADIVLHSVTKYYNGHGDVIAGAIIGRTEDMVKIKSKAVTTLCGTTPSPLSAFLILRGIQTMELRMERHCKNAMAIAELLDTHPYVEKVNYPGLKSYPQHDLALRQMNGMYGGIMSFVLKDGINGMDSNTAARKFLDSLTIPKIAVSLGNPATLIEHPASMTHKRFSKEERIKIGIPDGLLRLSVGLENTEDLLSDFTQALNQL